jgi:ESS family glutamate:Na+ symporter
MIAFFSSVGFGASLGLLKTGGPLVLRFFLIAAVVAVLQNVIGVLVAVPLGQNPLLGVLAGSVTLTGGPATGLAFAPLFQEAGVPAAATLAVAAAMVGIVSGGILGGPIGTFLIDRYHLRSADRMRGQRPAPTQATAIVESQLQEPPLPASPAAAGEDVEAYVLLKHAVVMLFAIWAGNWVSSGFAALNFTLPGYIGAMLVAAAIRNFDDVTKTIGLSQRAIDDLGSVSLSLFLALALMTLRLWEIAGLALPLTIVLAAQVALILAVSFLVFRLMGRDYDAAVMTGGFCGFMLGTTANSMANMDALVQRFGASPKAYLVVPMVGAFFIDFVNALIITGFLNLLK